MFVSLKQIENNYMRFFLMNGGKSARAIARLCDECAKLAAVATVAANKSRIRTIDSFDGLL